MKIYNMEQGTPEWHAIRKGKLTASHAQAIATNGSGLDTYVKKIVLALFIEDDDRYKGSDMERGNELEPVARAKYSFEKGVEVIEHGFIEMSKRVGYSPDGLVNDDGLIEIKARNNSIHLDLLINEKIDTKTIWQMQMGMLVTKRKWCDFISYNPNFKKNSLFVKRVYRDEVKIQKIRKGLYEGTKKIDKMLETDVIKAELKNVA